MKSAGRRCQSPSSQDSAPASARSTISCDSKATMSHQRLRTSGSDTVCIRARIVSGGIIPKRCWYSRNSAWCVTLAETV